MDSARQVAAVDRAAHRSLSADARADSPRPYFFFISGRKIGIHRRGFAAIEIFLFTEKRSGNGAFAWALDCELSRPAIRGCRSAQVTDGPRGLPRFETTAAVAEATT